MNFQGAAELEGEPPDCSNRRGLRIVMIDPQYVFGADVQQSDQRTDAVRRISSSKNARVGSKKRHGCDGKETSLPFTKYHRYAHLTQKAIYVLGAPMPFVDLPQFSWIVDR